MMNMKAFVFFLLLFFLPATDIFGCSIFMFNSATGAYFCSNEDWVYSDPVLGIMPPSAKNHGLILFGWRRYYPRYIQGGINEKGLCFDWANVPPQEYVRDPALRNFTDDLAVYLLKKCETVRQAVDIIQQYNYGEFSQSHLYLADRKGNACVVEWNHNKLQFVYRQKNYLVATNFLLTAPDLGWYPCLRYEAIEAILSGPVEESQVLDTCIHALDKAHQETPYPTSYSYIVDLQHLKLYVYAKYRFTKGKEYDIRQLIQKAAVIPIEPAP